MVPRWNQRHLSHFYDLRRMFKLTKERKLIRSLPFPGQFFYCGIDIEYIEPESQFKFIVQLLFKFIFSWFYSVSKVLFSVGSVSTNDNDSNIDRSADARKFGMTVQ